MNDQFEMQCPRCGVGRLRPWEELSEEERMVARRMPESMDYSQAEREATHRWCAQCGYEETENRPFDA
jgi:NMD protein affecting ribosome stability and mRNA decay